MPHVPSRCSILPALSSSARTASWKEGLLSLPPSLPLLALPWLTLPPQESAQRKEGLNKLMASNSRGVPGG